MIVVEATRSQKGSTKAKHSKVKAFVRGQLLASVTHWKLGYRDRQQHISKGGNILRLTPEDFRLQSAQARKPHRQCSDGKRVLTLRNFTLRFIYCVTAVLNRSRRAGFTGTHCAESSGRKRRFLSTYRLRAASFSCCTSRSAVTCKVFRRFRQHIGTSSVHGKYATR